MKRRIDRILHKSLATFPVGTSIAMALLLFVSAGIGAEEIRQLPSADGSTVPYLLSADLPDPSGEVRTAAILFSGGSGYVGLLEQGIPQPGANFLVRTRKLFVARGIPVAVIDTPSNMHGMSDAFRMSRRHIADIAAVADDLQKRFPDARLFLIGTSRGTVSAGYAGAALGEKLAGVVLTSSVFNSARDGAGLSGFDFGTIKVPLLFVHHAEDSCRVTPYQTARALSDKYPLISVHGGKAAASGPCEPFAAHGYFGKEEATVDAIANWMLGRPYPRDIE
jgi:hypothetical protein